MTRVLIAAGGTAGHVVPALAVAAELRSRGAEVVWIGGERAEAELVPAAGYRLHRVAVRGLSRSDPVAAVRAAGLAARATARAAAVLRRVPLALAEADSHLGMTNRLLAPFARRVCLAFPIEGRDGPKYRVTGRPVPTPAVDRDGARAELGVGRDEDLVLVFGGSLGARSVNQAAVEAFAGAPFRVLHAAGRRDFAELQAPRSGYDLRDYLPTDAFSRALLASDLVVARAGGSIFEICSHGRPAVLVPYPHASGDHQTANARWMADAGAAVIVPDAELTGPRLAREVAALFADRARLQAMGKASSALARPDAAERIADGVISLTRHG